MQRRGEVAEIQLSVEFLLCRKQNEFAVFKQQFLTVGSDLHADIAFAEEKEVAAKHCTLQYDGSKWILAVLNANKVWVNDRLVTDKSVLTSGAIVFLGRPMGPGFRVSMAADDLHLRGNLRELRNLRVGMMANAARAAVEKPFQRRVVKRWFDRLDSKHRRRLRRVTVALLILLTGAGGIAFYQHRKLSRMREFAENIFYQMKSVELRISRAEDIVAITGDSLTLDHNEEMWGQIKAMEEQYDAYLRELGFGTEKMAEDERVILQIARAFGECELNASPEFINQVRVYINKWRTTPRYREAITRALESGYIKHIATTMMRYHLPPHFLYLAMQESDFDTRRCGPRTRFGIAKGMWQFIPTTAIYFGLKLGPLVEVRQTDPQDERHNFYKSTEAAAKYLKLLYKTEAQASGLLVMASYNWGESKVRQLINRMPENPRDRNFWNLMRQYKLPRETRDYVFYIFSAAVIGENPKLFGFDIDSPVAPILN